MIIILPSREPGLYSSVAILRTMLLERVLPNRWKNCHGPNPAPNRFRFFSHFFWRQFVRYAIVALSLVLFSSLAAFAAELKGTITNAQGGEPLGKILVTVLETNFSATTSSDGTFHITGLPAGDYVLRVT